MRAEGATAIGDGAAGQVAPESSDGRLGVALARLRGLSLRTRLVAGLLVAIATIWIVWTCSQWHQFSRAQSGAWDRSLQEVARMILHSLPSGFEATRAEVAFPAPSPGAAGTAGATGGVLPPGAATREAAGAPAASAGAGRRLFKPMVYQVWLGGGRLVMRSPGAPTERLLPLDAHGPADVTMAGEPLRALGVRSADGRVEVLVAKSYAVLHEELRTWFWSSLWTALGVFLALASLVWAVIHWSLRPVDRVRGALLARDLHDARPLPTAGVPGELQPLLGAINDALARLHRSLQAERRFLADAAHELRTPLAALRAQAEVAQHARSPEATRAALERLGEGIDRCARLSAQVLDMARLEHGGPSPPARPLDLARVVQLVARDFELLAARRGQRLQLELAPCRLLGHTDELGILVRNLLDNALRYGRAGGRVQLRCALDNAPGPAGGARLQAVLQVRDDGPGVPEAERGRIFDRFYRAPAPAGAAPAGAGGSGGEGCGIGLSLVQRVAELHGARLSLGEGLDGRGLGVELRFAAAPAPRPEGATPDTAFGLGASAPRAWRG